jgi:protein involved in polysaccharide export with SLBB domain
MRWTAIFLLGAWAHAAAAQSPPTPAPTDEPHVVDPAALEGGIPAASYVVGPGDRLLLEMWGLHELTQELEVTAEGRLLVPRAGVFAAAGQTLESLRRAVQKRLAALYPRLASSLTLVRARTFLLHVTGAVARPGTYVGRPTMRVSGILPQAGGALPSGSLRRVEIRRRGVAQPLHADLVRFRLLGEIDRNPLLLDGDTIYVPSRARTVEVTGAVQRPGSYELVDGTLAEVLLLAGGRTPQASTELPIRVSARGAGDRVTVRSVNDDGAALDDGDVVHVPERADRGRIVVVEGAVVGPARDGDARRPTPATDGIADAPTHDVSVQLAFVDGDGVRDLVAKAGGLQPWADARAAYLLRDRQQIPVDVAAVLGGARDDVRVAPGDTLVIPTLRRQVLVSGAVQHPGLYQYSSELKPRDYISLAGGPTHSGNAGGARVLGQGGGSRPIGKVAQLQPGDVITVPEKRLTASEWTTIGLIIGNVAVGAVAIGLAASR